MGQRIAEVEITPQLLVDALHFDALGCEIVGARYDWARNCVRLMVRSPHLRELSTGEYPPLVVAVMRSQPAILLEELREVAPF